MSQLRNKDQDKQCIKEAMINFWDRVVFEYPELDAHDLPDVVKYNFPILCSDAVDRALKHAKELKKIPPTSEELLGEIVEQLNMLPNSKLLTCTSYQLIEKINKHLDSK